MSVLFMNVGSDVDYNRMVGIATSWVNSDQTFCGFQLQLVRVPFAFQNLGKGQVWDFQKCSAVIITFIWEWRHLLTSSHCSSTYVNNRSSVPGTAHLGVWQKCLSHRASRPTRQAENGGGRQAQKVPEDTWWQSRSPRQSGSGEGNSSSPDLDPHHAFRMQSKDYEQGYGRWLKPANFWISQKWFCLNSK